MRPVKESEKETNLHTADHGDPADRESSVTLQPLHASVSLEAEVPEALFEGMRDFIRDHPHWDQYSVITSALAGFLFQNGSCESCVRDHYLAGLFSEP